MDELIVRFFSGDTSSEENQAITHWIQESKANREFFETFRNLWLASAQIPSPKTVYSQSHSLSLPGLANPLKRNFIRELLKIAAIFIFALFTGAFGYHWMSGSQSSVAGMKTVTFESRRGAMSVVVMPDGSKVWLNAGSKISYDQRYNLSQREVILTGEAYFDVVTNPSKPFVVKAGKLAIKALGTLFNVKAYPEEHSIITTLERGKIVIEGKDSHNKAFTVDLKPKQTVVYFADQKDFIAIQNGSSKSGDKSSKNEVVSHVAMNELSMIKMDAVKTELYTSWRGENWVIEKQNMGNLAQQLERRYNISIEFASENIKKYRFSGTIQNETIEQIMEIMRSTMPLSYSIEKGKIIVKEDKKLMQEFNR
jgi:ferric-dicitrate binding protein FerR (iron transport regulator)